MNMLVTLLFTWPNVTGMPIGERVAYALRMLIVGLGAVFAILALLWGVLVLSRILLHDMPSRRREAKTGKVEKTSAPAQPAVVSVPVAPVAQPTAQDNGVLIAVITAAVSAAMAEEGTTPPGGFRVVSFRRASNTGAWNRK